MTPWVHDYLGKGQIAYEPPKPVPGKGYPRFYVEFGKFRFHFVSLEEIEVCIDTLSKKNMPNPNHEDVKEPAAHWLARLPSYVKPWRFREGAVEYLREAQTIFQKETGLRIREPKICRRKKNLFGTHHYPAYLEFFDLEPIHDSTNS